MENSDYILSFENSLTSRLLTKARFAGDGPDSILEVEELTQKWDTIAPYYMSEAVKQFNDYPTATLAWAAYLGMAMANIWDSDFERLQCDTLYEEIVSARGWDEMDEYICQEILSIEKDSHTEQEISSQLLSIAKEAMTSIRREAVEPGSANAFYILVSAIKVMYNIGISLQLHRLGYKYEKVKVDIPTVS